MMLRRTRIAQAASLFCAGLLLAGCAEQSQIKHNAPPIRTIGRDGQPDKAKLAIEESPPVEAQPDLALDNYRKLLELNASPEVRAEATRRIADLQIQVIDEKGNNPEVAGKVLAESIAMYQKLLAEQPNNPANDGLLYQMARAYQNSGQIDQAINTLLRLEKEYPLSNLALDSHARVADLLYTQKRYAEAEKEYSAVMSYGPGSVFYEPAQYKSGWSQYQQGKFNDAIGTFFTILDRDLPDDAADEPEEALAGVAPDKLDFARDALRVVGLSFVALGGGKSINQYYDAHGEPRFSVLIYNSLAQTQLAKQTYTAAATTYAAFIQRHPQDERAPLFQTKIISANDAGGFSETVIAEKERYVNTYAPGTTYWAGKAPTDEVMGTLRKYLDDVAKYHHALAQADRKGHQSEFLVAADWYRKTLAIFPKDPQAPATNLLLADALLDGGQTRAAADEYTRTSYDYPHHERSEDAAYAAVQAYEKRVDEVPEADKQASRLLAIDSAVRLADTYPQHAQKLPVLTRAAEDLHANGDLPRAIQVASRVIGAQPAAPQPLLRSTWAVTADSQFALGQFAESEKAYRQLLGLLPNTDPGYGVAVEQLAVSIYKQADAARTAGDLKTAAQGFLRVGQSAPTAKIRPTADYDAAAAFIQLKDWNTAEQVLESFRNRYPNHPLLPDVDKKLAVAYESDNKPQAAAQAYQRIFNRTTETPDVRAEAGWSAATLYDKAKQPLLAANAYEAYVAAFPRPFERQLDARERLSQIYQQQNDQPRYQQSLRALIAADAGAGADRNDRSRALAARASLEIGRSLSASAAAVRLSLPLNQSLASKKQATESAIQMLTQAANYGFADVATAATFELGQVYQQFARALLDSERPRTLKGDELEQYNLLLEEQADPFETKAIQAHETNLQRLRVNVYDQWVAKSVDALAKLAPAKYGKIEQKEASYDTLR